MAEIKERLYRSQYEAMKQVNATFVQLYGDIGRGIVEKQQVHKWGRSVVKNLSIDLQTEFVRMSGLSADNLWRMRKFYLNYKM